MSFASHPAEHPEERIPLFKGRVAPSLLSILAHEVEWPARQTSWQAAGDAAGVRLSTLREERVAHTTPIHWGPQQHLAGLSDTGHTAK